MDAPERYKGMRERQVAVQNPDGTVTVHRFWTDSHDAPARVSWADEDRGGGGYGLIDWSAAHI